MLELMFFQKFVKAMLDVIVQPMQSHISAFRFTSKTRDSDWTMKSRVPEVPRVLIRYLEPEWLQILSPLLLNAVACYFIFKRLERTKFWAQPSHNVDNMTGLFEAWQDMGYRPGSRKCELVGENRTHLMLLVAFVGCCWMRQEYPNRILNGKAF